MPEDKPEMLVIELCKQGHSGFFQDDTVGTSNPIELHSASLTFIPTEGWRGIEFTDENGKKIKKLEKIRWIKGHEEISVARQKILGLEPERSGNQITIEKDTMMIVREGGTIGLFDYIRDVSFNENALLRSERATALYRTLKPDEGTDEINDNELMQADAMKYVGTLYMKMGDKRTFKEDKIDALSSLFGIIADSYSGKVNGLLAYAKRNAEDFLKLATKFEQTTITEISHGLQLNVIKFDGHAAMYVTKDKVIKTFNSAVKMKQDEKIEELAAYFRTPAGNEAYTEYRAELEYAQEKALSNK